MYVPLMVKTDYSLLKSLIKVKNLSDFNTIAIGIVDNNLSYVMEFYLYSQKNNFKSIVGLDIVINNYHLYLYAKNYIGFLNLVKLYNIKAHHLVVADLETCSNAIAVIIPYESNSLYGELKNIYKDLYIGYKNDYEKQNSLLITNKVVYCHLILCSKKEEEIYLKYLEAIDTKCLLKDVTTNYEGTSFDTEINKEDELTTLEFAKLINFEMDLSKRYIPKIVDSETKLVTLVKKGIAKRLNNEVPKIYQERIKYEFDVIKEMGFIDYFMIVYDYVLYAKKHNIYVGPGRGSAAGCLICYALGITSIDPIKFNLLFERFLNKERVTLPDIDIDFDAEKRNQIIDYVKEKYGDNNISLILSFDTLKARQALRDVGKILEIDDKTVDNLSKLLNQKLSLKDNLSNKEVINYIKENNLKKMYQDAINIEDLKKHISTHAAGVVISSDPLNELIPLESNGSNLLTGWTMDYLEKVGFIKMDVLSLENLSTISKIKELIKINTKEDINLNDISLEDKKTLNLFYNVDTLGIFQFESKGMMNFLKKLKVTSFNDLVMASALFRPGPMDNIDGFIKRREGKSEIDYFDKRLEVILKDTYGIIVFQEQVLEILKLMGGYSYAEADLIRRAMSKKKLDIINKERDHFVTNAVNNNYSKEIALKVYGFIAKFGGYGFNKSHSVSYALIGYQMAYLKSNYRISFMTNILNQSIGNELKTKYYLNECKNNDIKVIKPNVNFSKGEYYIDNLSIIMPLTTIKNVGREASERIVSLRNNKYNDYFDFVKLCYGKSVNKKVLENIINAGACDDFNANHHTLVENIDSAITYSELANNLDESLVMKPILEVFDEYDQSILMKNEIDLYGFYISNHPASKYINGIIKSNELIKYFDKYIKTVVLVENISKIKTKNNDDMAFIDANDEYGNISFVVFPKKISLLTDLKKGSLVQISGQVTKRYDKYQIICSNLNLIK